MKNLILFTLLFFVVLLIKALGADAPVTFRNVQIHVVDTNGKPAAHRKVTLMGLERWSLEPGDDSGGAKYWHFVTNQKGNATIPLGDFAGWLDNEVRPGWGVYAVVVTAGPNDAGGVSSRFWFDNAPTHAGQNPNSENWANEWGSIVPVPAPGLSLTIALQAGFTLKGQIVDDQHPEIPLAGVNINTVNDFHADTHTGMGGRILGSHATTDASGNFSIPHQYPTDFSVSIQSAAWLKTKVDGKWENHVKGALSPPVNGEMINLEIGAAKTPRFKYYGKVFDAAGQPVVSAQVEMYVQSQSEPASATWEEERSGQQTKTGADGSYEFLSPTPWMIGISAEIPGQPSAFSKKKSDNELLSPGEYDLTFPAPKTAAK